MTAATDYALRKAVRAERARRELSQEAVAARMGLARSTYAAIEQGTRSLRAHELVELCAALECHLSVLVMFAPDQDRAALGL